MGEKETVKQTQDVDLFSGEIEDVIARLTKLRDEKRSIPGVTSVHIDQVWTGYEMCHEELVVERLETDEETAERIAKEEEIKKQEEERREAERKKQKEIKRLEQQLSKIRRS